MFADIRYAAQGCVELRMWLASTRLARPKDWQGDTGTSLQVGEGFQVNLQHDQTALSSDVMLHFASPRLVSQHGNAVSLLDCNFTNSGC